MRMTSRAVEAGLRRGRGPLLSGLLALSGVAEAASDPYGKPAPDLAGPALKACLSSRLPEYRKGECLLDRIRELRARLKASVDLKLAAIEAVGTRAPSPGSLAGREDADQWRKAFLASQAAWEEYFRLHCDSLYDYDFHGGSAAGQLASACKIRLLGARLGELAPTP